MDEVAFPTISSSSIDEVLYSLSGIFIFLFLTVLAYGFNH